MMRKIDLTGKRFGRLLVIEQSKNSKDNQIMWLCKCDCGKETIVRGQCLTRKTTKSCGCYRKKLHAIHGKYLSVEYTAWHNMKQRCYNKKHPEYPNYGGRGVSICSRWLNSFKNFFADMGLRPSSEHSLDRFPNTNGNYKPDNCRWATDEMQNRNTRRNRWIEKDGIKMVLTDWAKLFGVRSTHLGRSLKTKTFDDVYEFHRKRMIKRGKVLVLPNSSC